MMAGLRVRRTTVSQVLSHCDGGMRGAVTRKSINDSNMEGESLV